MIQRAATPLTRLIHPVNWIVFCIAQIFSAIVANNALMLLAMTVFNCTIVYYSATSPFVKRLPRLVAFSAVWGAMFLPVFRCHSLSLECASNVGSYLSRILLFFSSFGMLGAVIDGDRFIALLLSRGVPLSVCITLSRVVSFFAELVKSGADAYAIHALAGRSIRTYRDRFRLLGEIVISTVSRVLVRDDEVSAARESRLLAYKCRPQMLLTESFTFWDWTLLSATLLLLCLQVVY